MITYFTADMHLGHANICLYCERPQVKPIDYIQDITTHQPRWITPERADKRVREMNTMLIRNWNARVAATDLVYHLGDFCFKGGVQGGGVPAQYWESQLNGKIIHIRGNHDSNSGIRDALESAVLRVGHHTWWLCHKRPWSINELPPGCHAVLCGHSHKAWAIQWLDAIPIINVGVDVQRFMPQAKQEIITQISRAQGARKQRADNDSEQRDG